MRNAEHDKDERERFLHHVAVAVVPLSAEPLRDEQRHGGRHRSRHGEEHHARLCKDTDRGDCRRSEGTDHDDVGVAEEDHKNALKSCGNPHPQINFVIRRNHDIPP